MIIKWEEGLINRIDALFFQRLKVLINIKNVVEKKIEGLSKFKFSILVNPIVKIYKNFYYSVNYHHYFIFNILLFKKRTKNLRLRATLRMFFLKEIFVTMPEKKICNILSCFLENFTNYLGYESINVILHYLIIPVLLYYDKMKMNNELVELYLIKELSNKLIQEEIYKNSYDEATNLEVIKLIIVINTYFWHCFNEKDLEEYNNKTLKYLYLKYNSPSAALVLYSLLGIVTNTNLRNKLTPDKFVNYYLRSSHIDQLNIGNLSYDIFINYSLSKPLNLSVQNNNINIEEP